jgi:hypothetical protein
MPNKIPLYSKIEGYENRLGHVYIGFHERFKDRPDLARFWSDAALEEMQHGAILRFCREHGNLTSAVVDDLICDHIESLIETVASVARKPDLSVNEAFYASLLVEASELDDLYARLIEGLLPDHRLLYESIEANLRSHHVRFAEAADRFLSDPAFVAAFRNLSRKHHKEINR